MEFFCYAYGRLSKEDLDKKVESDSIKNQRDLIHDFIDRDPELHLVMEGYDDGYTGTSFERPHVREMLEAVKSGKVNCVVVKDLSRFGRPTQALPFRKSRPALLPGALPLRAFSS